ncbi:MAG: DNA modification methylase [Actinomycetota bacterium]|nr:DNA modification methylase [Actinomycetota bacterium]
MVQQPPSQGGENADGLRVDRELAELLPAPLPSETAALRANIAREGRILDPIVAWRRADGDVVVVDGHQRRDIARELGLPCPVREVEFAGLHKAAAWRAEAQAGRRNLTEAGRAQVALLRLAEEQAAAKERQREAGNEHGRGKPRKLPQRIGEAKERRSGETNRRLAAGVGLSHETVRRARVLAEKRPDLWRRTRANEITVGEAHKTFLLDERHAEQTRARNAAADLLREASESGRAVWLWGHLKNEIDKLADDSVKLLLVDPPFGANYRSNHRIIKHEKVKHDKHLKGALRIFRKMLRLIMCKLTADAHVVVFVDQRRGLWWFAKALEEAGLFLRQPILWDAERGGSPRVAGGDLDERAMLLIHASVSMTRLPAHRHNYFRCARHPHTDDHPTPKPIPLLREIIEALTLEGELVADCFGGGASTLVAAIESGRRAWGCEIIEKYHLVGEARIAEALRAAEGEDGAA